MSVISEYLIKRGRSFKYAFRGLGYVVRNEANFIIHIFAAVVVILLGLVCDLKNTEWLIIVLTIALVMTTEIVNSAIEQLIDFVHPEINKKAGRIKDISAGAVLLSAIAAVFIGLLIFVPKLIELL